MWKSGQSSASGALSATCSAAAPPRPLPGSTLTTPTVFWAAGGQTFHSRWKPSIPRWKSVTGSTSRPLPRSTTRMSSKSTSPGTCPKRKCMVAVAGSSSVGEKSNVTGPPVCSTRSGRNPGRPRRSRPYRLAVNHQARGAGGSIHPNRLHRQGGVAREGEEDSEKETVECHGGYFSNCERPRWACPSGAQDWQLEHRLARPLSPFFPLFRRAVRGEHRLSVIGGGKEEKNGEQRLKAGP